jgi:hypothetical protein
MTEFMYLPHPSRAQSRLPYSLERPRLVLMRGTVLLLLGGVQALGVLGAFAQPASAAATSGDSNWAGYVSSGRGTRFTHVSGRWVQPAVSCTRGRSTYMSSWIGLGGDSSQILEQIGTEADCDAGGRATYSSWFELYPTVSGSPKLTIRPGDVVSAGVTVIGGDARLNMTDETRGTRFSRVIHGYPFDVSSAEWIVEAPAVCLTGNAASCRGSRLSNFGSTGFTQARASAAGHTGTVTDEGWTSTAYAIGGGSTNGSGSRAARSPQSGSRAVPGALSGHDDAFGISFAA